MKFFSKLVFTALLFIIITNSNALDRNKFVEHPNIVLCDIGETLISVNSFETIKFFANWGMLGFVIGSIFHGNFNIVSNVRDFYLDKLSLIPSPYSAPNYVIKTVNNKPMPPLMRDSHLGKISLNDCLRIGNEWIKSNQNKFSNKYQQSLFETLFNLNFNPNALIKQYKYTSYIKLLKKVYEECDDQGKRKNVVIILSNQPKEMVPLIKDKFSDIYSYSDAQVYSCFEGYSKPHIKLFEKCLSLCPDCFYQEDGFIFFIDDEQYNVETSKNLVVKNRQIVSLYPHEAETALLDFDVISK